MIDFEHVSMEYKRGGRLALEDVSLHVDPGEFVFLVGHSGAGKSTLLKLILREVRPVRARSLWTARMWHGCGAARCPIAPADGCHLSGLPADPHHDGL